MECWKCMSSLDILSDKLYILFLLNVIYYSAANPPNIDYSHNMRVLKLPKNLKVGTIVYRLKGTDADNDVIEFGVRGPIANRIFEVKKVSFYEADVCLRSSLEDMEYNITIYAFDGKEFTEVESTVFVTEVEENFIGSPFIYNTNTFKIFENTTTNATIGFVKAKDKENSNLPVTFELRGSENFAIRYVFGPRGTSKADIILIKNVDYEKQSVYALTILALNAWTNESVDSRNVAAIDLLIIINDVQDTPPIFQNLPKVVRIAENAKMGTIIFKAIAEDGDYGNPRNISYSIDQNSILHSYFAIDAISGDIVLRKQIQDIKSDIGTTEPMLLSVNATEITENIENATAITTISDVALVITSTINKPPRFKYDHLIGSIDENSQSMTPVKWEGLSVPQVLDDDPGLNGTIVLDIEDASDTFMIQPNRGINELTFSIVVKNDKHLDYESNTDKQFNLIISATDQSAYMPLTTKVLCTIKLNDLNDNIPQFSKKIYEASISEDASPGLAVVLIEATDLDSGDFGKIHFTSINGPLSDNLKIDSITGIIVLDNSDGIDRELISEYRITIEARDDLGRGNRNVSELHIKILDVNDNPPIFLQSRYDAVLRPDRSNFTQPLVVKALDADESDTVNSNVSYEIINGNYQDKFAIDQMSGEIVLTSPLLIDNSNSKNLYFTDKFYPEFVLTVRAHDHGIPYRSSLVFVHIFNPDFLNRSVAFLVNQDYDKVYENIETIKEGLSMITGGKVHISREAIVARKDGTLVNAWIAYPTQSMIDLSKMPLIFSMIMGKDYDKKDANELRTVQIASSDFQTLFWLLVVLVLVTLLFLIIFIICWCCCCRKERKQKLDKLSDDMFVNRNYKNVANGSVVKESNSIGDNQWNNTINKSKHDVALQADTIARPSSAPHYERYPYSAHNRADSSRSFRDSGSMYHKFRKYKHQRTRVGPQYYGSYDDGFVPKHQNGPYFQPYYSLQSQKRPNVRHIRDDDLELEYIDADQINSDAYLRRNALESNSLQRNRPKVNHLVYDDKLLIPKKTEILYIQSPSGNERPVNVMKSFGQNEPNLGEYSAKAQNNDNYGVSESTDANALSSVARRRRLHVSFDDRNTAPIISDGLELEEMSVTTPKLVSEQINEESNSSVDSMNSIEHTMNANNYNHKSQTLKPLISFSTKDSRKSVQANGEISIPNSVSNTQIMSNTTDTDLKLENLKKLKSLNTTNASKSRKHLSKQLNSDNSEKSDDSDSGIGRSAIDTRVSLDMKNRELMEKKSVFTIAYDGVKTRHLQSAESVIE